ncbi:MAG TPA: polymer-forming cytoskeletal protein [Rickettsiales bacterium]|nr:polymer-forming cytoskeletal protein [Rickettsiales bacterium]
MPIVNLKPKVLEQDILNDNKRKKKIEVLTGKNFKTTPTILSHDLHIEGDIISEGLVEIEGFVKGTLKGNCVIIREDGSFEGDLMAESLNIKGNFQGNIKANTISISSKAKINGVVEYNTLCVEDGASIDGQFKKV